MSIVTQSPSQRGEIAELFIRHAALWASMLCSVRSCYNLATTNALPWRLCYLDIVNTGASATLPLRSWRSGQSIPGSNALLKLVSLF